MKKDKKTFLHKEEEVKKHRAERKTELMIAETTEPPEKSVDFKKKTAIARQNEFASFMRSVRQLGKTCFIFL